MGTMFNALLKTGELLKSTHRGIATGGSTTTLIDTGHVVEPDDWYNGGRLFMLSGDNANTTISPITDYVKTTGVFTFATITTAVALGNEYVALRGRYNRESLVMGINMALAELGPVPRYDILTPSELGDDTYLVSGVYNIKRIEYTETSSEPYAWVLHEHLEEVNSRIVFDPDYVKQAVKFRIWYEKPHDYIDDDDDTVSDVFHPMLVAWTAAYYCALSRMQRTELDEPFTAEFVALANSMRQKLAQQFPVRRIHRTIRKASWT